LGDEPAQSDVTIYERLCNVRAAITFRDEVDEDAQQVKGLVLALVMLQ
jgi:hypothetical protein